MIQQVEDAGFKVVDNVESADVYVLNTCTVTHIADRKARHLFQMTRRKNPQAKVIAVGCYAERAASELLASKCVDAVITKDEKSNLIQRMQELGKVDPVKLARTGQYSGHTRSFIKVQEGCTNYCSYCIVPFVRHNEQCLSPDLIVGQIRQRVSAGFREVVLTGTEIGRYRVRDTSLDGLLERILRETKIERLRISSLQPQEVTPVLVNLWQDRRLCPHFHLPLQSGSDTILKKMGRRYTIQEYRAALAMIRAQLPEAAITTDIMVGFPGESPEDFTETLDSSKKLRFARIHVFSYSPRQGTAAAIMPDPVKEEEKKRRSCILISHARQSMAEYCSHYTGRTLDVLIEGRKDSLWSGYTANYIKVFINCVNDVTNRIVPVRLTGKMKDGMKGELV